MTCIGCSVGSKATGLGTCQIELMCKDKVGNDNLMTL